MDRETIKKFCKVDYDDDDWYFDLLIDVAKEYFEAAITTYDETKARHKLLILNLIKTLYEERAYTVDESNTKISYTIRSMILQLQLDEVL